MSATVQIVSRCIASILTRCAALALSGTCSCHAIAQPATGLRLENYGTVLSIRGSVIDVRFDHGLPPIHNLLRAGDSEGGS